MAFTLVEVVIVIGILCILAAILLPVLSSARQRSQATVCASNLRQLYLATAQYAADNNGILPPDPTTFNFAFLDGALPAVDRAAELVKVMHPYTGSKDIWFCPLDKFARTPSTEGDVNHQFTSYATSEHWYLLKMPEHYPILGRTPLDLTHAWTGIAIDPAQAFLFTDDTWECQVYPNEVPLPYSHNGRFNAVAFDGHIISFARDQDPTCRFGIVGVF